MLYFQSAPGKFDLPLVSLRPPSIPPYMFGPTDVALADVDGDGALDLVAPSGITLKVFFQGAPRTFDDVRTWFLYSMAPESVAAVIDEAYSVAAADLDGDGDLDLVSANWESRTLTIFWGGR